MVFSLFLALFLILLHLIFMVLSLYIHDYEISIVDLNCLIRKMSYFVYHFSSDVSKQGIMDVESVWDRS